MLHKIGAILMAIGIFLLLPFDEILILVPLIAMFGPGVIPVFYFIAFFILILGAVLLGKHVMPILLKNPIVIVVLVLATLVAVGLIYFNVWTL